jgi:hypothetical protein
MDHTIIKRKRRVQPYCAIKASFIVCAYELMRLDVAIPIIERLAALLLQT